MMGMHRQSEIEHSGVTVAAIFFKNVFGTTAERALAVFVALRCVHLLFVFLLLRFLTCN